MEKFDTSILNLIGIEIRRKKNYMDKLLKDFKLHK